MFSKVNDFVEAKKSNFSIYFDWNPIFYRNIIRLIMITEIKMHAHTIPSIITSLFPFQYL